MFIINKIRQGIKSDFSTTVLANFGIVALNGLSGIMLARLLGPGGRGEFAAAVAWSALLSFVVELAIPHASTYLTARNPEKTGDIFTTICAIWLVQSVISIVVGYTLITLIFSQSQPTALEITRTYAFSVPFVLVAAYLRGITQGLKRFRLYNFLRLAETVPYILSALIGTVFSVHDAFHIILIMLLLQIISGVSTTLIFWRTVKPLGKIRRAVFVELLKYGLKAYWGNLSWITNARLDQLIMSAVVSLDDLGQYSVAVAYSGFLFPISTAFSIILLPSVSSTTEARGRHEIWRTFRLNLFIIVLGILILGFASPYLIPLLFGNEFTGAIPPATILLVGALFYGSNFVLSDGLRGLGRPLQTSIAEVVGAIVTIVGLIILIPVSGVMGAALVSVLGYASVNLSLVRSMLSFRQKQPTT